MDSRIAEKIKPTNIKRRRVSFVEARARLPLILRYVALAALVFTLIYVGIVYWRLRNTPEFRLRNEQPQLSMEVVAVVNGYERRVTEGDKLKMLVRADRETTYADGRHELDNIFLEVYPSDTEKPDRIIAAKAVYTPDNTNPENFVVNFTGNVQFESRDGLKAQTDQIAYDKQQELAQTASWINFSRENIAGSANGAVLHVKEKKLELQNAVEINVSPNGNSAKNSLTDFGTSAVKINAARAFVDHNLDQFELNGGVLINISQENSEQAPTTIRAEKAVYEKNAEKLDLSGGVEIVTASDNTRSLTGAVTSAPSSVPVFIRASAVSYEQGNGKIHLAGGANIQQGNEYISGDSITANINKQKKLENVLTNNNAFLRTTSGNRMTEVNASEMFARFDINQQLNLATATGNVKIKSTDAENEINLTDSSSLVLNFNPVKERSLLERMRTEGNTNVSLLTNNSSDYSKIEMHSLNNLEIFFNQSADQSVLKQMQTGGRTEIRMYAPQAQSGNPKATNKRLIADSVKLMWSSSGKDLSRAEAIGNAELYVMPLQNSSDLDKQSLFASRLDTDFYDSGNLAKTFTAIGNVKAVLEPTVSSEQRSIRTLTSDKMISTFERQSQAVESVTANGNAKFNEQDRNGIANNFSYTSNDEIVRLRGGEPTIWDSRARLKAIEIDWNTRSEISNMSGKVATTYYSQEQTGGSAPFAKVNSPVFLTSNNAEFNHVTGTAIYQGNARAWQDNNFVRADKLILRRDSRTMFGEGKVQSALYNSKRRENGVEKVVPVFAASDRIVYSDEQKLLRYESNVDIRQGTERLTSGIAEVFLSGANEVSKTVTQNSVVITQPGRKATGDWAQYTTADEVVILRGNPALIEDAEQGNSSGRQVVVYLRENRIVGQGSVNQAAPGRVRSTHKVKNQ